MDVASMGIGFGFSALGIIVAAIVNRYLINRDKKSETTDEDLKKFKEDTLKDRGDIKAEMATFGGKIDNLADKLEIYTKGVTKLEGKVELNTDALTKQTTLLDHSIRQNKRLFEHLGLRRNNEAANG